ncbi:divergent protein kinase domain 2B isoform X2 [Rattus norvegicus]|uniref:divergent protein kinase domain 2B isoform X2 n=1 Tax=Rattus norvegicus TaxID=10116 RepID=UPI001916CF7B|nr:divergent protein kinase domain 2B isoform X2 [Rattus norvegicus]
MELGRPGAAATAFRQRWPAWMLLWVSTLSCSFSLPASLPPSLVPRVRSSYTLGKTFLGLDKCNACIGTSICKKFFKEEIRLDNSLVSHLGLPSQDLLSYAANYSDDSKTWRPVEISRLVSKYQSEISDKRICASASGPKTCSIERILRKTGRFQKWLQAKRLTPDLVQGLPSPFLHCPSQRLLDRVVRRYAEVVDAGSIFMDHFTDRDKLRLLYTLAVNAHPIILQIFPGAEGWPMPKYLGSCGRFLPAKQLTGLERMKTFLAAWFLDARSRCLPVTLSLRSKTLCWCVSSCCLNFSGESFPPLCNRR